MRKEVLKGILVNVVIIEDVAEKDFRDKTENSNTRFTTCLLGYSEIHKNLCRLLKSTLWMEEKLI